MFATVERSTDQFAGGGRGAQTVRGGSKDAFGGPNFYIRTWL